MSDGTYPTCVLWTEYDFTAAAGLFSQVAGVLAGFAFVAITTVVTAKSLPQRAGFVSGTGCALLGLIATTTLYATNAAERGCALVAGAAATTEVLAGVAFAASVYTLLFSLVELVSGLAVGKHLRIIVSLVAPPVVTLFVVASLSDYALSFADPPDKLPATDFNAPTGPAGSPVPRPSTWREMIEPHWLDSGDKAFWQDTNCAAMWLPLTVFGVCVGSWLLARWLQCRNPQWVNEFPRVTAGVQRLKELVPYASIALVVLAVGQTVNMSLLDPSTNMRRWQALGLVGGVAALVTAMSAVLAFITEVDDDQKNAHLNHLPRQQLSEDTPTG